MKELSIEEKAKAYDEVREKIAIRFGSNVADEIFSQFEMSEDERIRKALIDFFNEPGRKEYILNEFNVDKIVAWLEKQGGHAKFINGIQVGDKVTRNEDGVLVNLSQLNRVAKKQGEQKPTDKAEPKFHEGEWITHNTANFVFKIINVGSNSYDVVNRENYKKTISFDNEDNYHLWTIADAKDGDVLAYRDGQWIFIYKEKIDDNSFSYYTLYSTIHQDLTINDAGFTLLGSAIVPATKEQRDLLFQKMKDAGYEWDAEKKELKKIGNKNLMLSDEYERGKTDAQNPAWSEMDETYSDHVINAIKSCYTDYKGKENPFREPLLNWLNSLKDRYTWKPSKKQMEALNDAIAICSERDYETECKLDNLRQNLKKLYKL